MAQKNILVEQKVNYNGKTETVFARMNYDDLAFADLEALLEGKVTIYEASVVGAGSATTLVSTANPRKLTLIGDGLIESPSFRPLIFKQTKTDDDIRVVLKANCKMSRDAVTGVDKIKVQGTE